MTRHYPDLGSDASSIWNFCVLVSQMSFGWETSSSVAKCRPFSQANITNSPRSMYQNSNMIPARLCSHFSLFGLVFGFHIFAPPCNILYIDTVERGLLRLLGVKISR